MRHRCARAMTASGSTLERLGVPLGGPQNGGGGAVGTGLKTNTLE